MSWNNLQSGFSNWAKVNDRFSKLIDGLLRAKVSDEKMKEKAGRFKRPQNCQNLVLPKVNPEIWSKMASRAKSRDLNLQNVQIYLISWGRFL